MRASAGPTGQLTLVHLPVSLRVESHLQKAVLGVVSFPAAWADQITSPGRTLMVVILRHGESCSAAAGHQEHAQVRRALRMLLGFAPAFHHPVPRICLTTLRLWQTTFSCVDSTAEFSCAAAATWE